MGRHAEIDAARSLLAASGPARGVQITGPGGIGKTTIARRLVAELHAEDRPCAVIERRLNASLVVARVARVLPSRAAWLRRATDDAERIRRLAAVMCDEPLILVLDGLDRHLTPATGQLRDRGTQQLVMRLAQAAQVGAGRILVTSRGPVDDLTGLLAVLPLVPLSDDDLEESLAGFPRVQALLDDLSLGTRQVIGGYPRLTELADAALGLGRPTRRRLRNELGQKIDLAPSMVRDRLLRMIVDRLDDRAWELLAHVALADRPLMTSTLADALGTTAREHVGQVAGQLAAIGILLAVGPDRWLLDAWTASGVWALESSHPAACARHLRMADAYHRAERDSIGLDDAEEAILHQLAAGDHLHAGERAVRLSGLLMADGQGHRAVALLSEVWEGMPVSQPTRDEVGAALRRATGQLDSHGPTADVARPEPLRFDTPPADTEIHGPAPLDDPIAEVDVEQQQPSPLDDIEHPEPVQVDLRSSPSTDGLLDEAERLMRDQPDAAACDEIEQIVERLEQVPLDRSQTERLLRLLRSLDDVRV